MKPKKPVSSSSSSSSFSFSARRRGKLASYPAWHLSSDPGPASGPKTKTATTPPPSSSSSTTTLSSSAASTAAASTEAFDMRHVPHVGPTAGAGAGGWLGGGRRPSLLFRRTTGPTFWIDLAVAVTVGVVSGIYIFQPPLQQYWAQQQQQLQQLEHAAATASASGDSSSSSPPPPSSSSTPPS